MAVKAFPSNAPSSLESLCLLVDDIWYSAGDRSTDMNWYSKRAVLAAIYSTTGRLASWSISLPSGECSRGPPVTELQ